MLCRPCSKPNYLSSLVYCKAFLFVSFTSCCPNPFHSPWMLKCSFQLTWNSWAPGYPQGNIHTHSHDIEVGHWYGYTSCSNCGIFWYSEMLLWIASRPLMLPCFPLLDLFFNFLGTQKLKGYCPAQQGAWRTLFHVLTCILLLGQCSCGLAFKYFEDCLHSHNSSNSSSSLWPHLS